MAYENEYNGDHINAYPNPYEASNMSAGANEYENVQTSYPYHSRDGLNMPRPQTPTVVPRTYGYEYPPTPRAPQPTQTTNGHVHDGANCNANNTEPTNYLSPEVLSQITAQVIQQLKTTGLDSLSNPGAPSQPEQSSRKTDLRSPLGPNAVRGGTSTPPNPRLDKANHQQPSVTDDEDEMRPSPISPRSPGARRSSSHESERSNLTRPKPPNRAATVAEMTTLEKIWGQLFQDTKLTKDAKSTDRLSQFLRGIAVHLIEDYEPKHSIIIRPEKLQQFYKDTHVPEDPYPWDDIFDDKTSSISRVFRELRIEHYLVQSEFDPLRSEDHLRDRPDIPGLTPKGFAQWVTKMILSNPSREYERLAKALLNMPISNPDDRTERFPKELPRRLFPDLADLELREEIEEYLKKHSGIELPAITAEERSQTTQPETIRSPTTPYLQSPPQNFSRSRSYERSRPSKTAPADDSAQNTDSEDNPIARERERNPYSTGPGASKPYDNHGPGSPVGSLSTRASALAAEANLRPSSRSGYRRDHRDSLRVDTSPQPPSRSPSRSYRHSETDLSRGPPDPRYSRFSKEEPYLDSPVAFDERPTQFRSRDMSRGGDYRSSMRGYDRAFR